MRARPKGLGVGLCCGRCTECARATRVAGAPLRQVSSLHQAARNREIPATADRGLCGPDRTDLADRTNFCGTFKVPTPRNVATRKVSFHNGRFKSLREALRFYVRRDTNPDEFYPRDDLGAVRKFDDLSPELAGNVNPSEVPYDRKPGEAPRSSEAEVDDLEAFLATITSTS